jgi:CBS domain-containing protein
MTRIAEVMTTLVHSCGPTQTLSDAAAAMRIADCGFVPVVNGAGILVGVVTDRDVCLAAFRADRPLSELMLVEGMRTPVVHLSEDDDLETAEKLMQAQQVRRIPITAPDGRLVGVVSLADLARAPETSSEAVDAVVGAVSAPLEQARALP